MPRNTIVGKSKKAGSTKATGRDYSKESAYNKARTKYRTELNAEARKRGIYGKRYASGKDLSHKKDGSMVLESRQINRGRNGKNGKSTKK